MKLIKVLVLLVVFFTTSLANSLSNPFVQTNHTEKITHIKISNNGKYLLTSSRDNTLILWDIKSKKVLQYFIGHEKGVITFIFSSDDSTIISTGADKTTILWDMKTAKVLKKYVHKNEYIISLDINKDDSRIVMGTTKGNIILWEINSNHKKIIKVNNKSIDNILFSSDDKYIISTSKDHTIKIWNFKTLKLLQTLVGHDGNIYSIAINDKNKNIASIGFDNTLRIWDIKTGKQIEKLDSNNFYLLWDNLLKYSIRFKYSNNYLTIPIYEDEPYNSRKEAVNQSIDIVKKIINNESKYTYYIVGRDEWRVKKLKNLTSITYGLKDKSIFTVKKDTVTTQWDKISNTIIQKFYTTNSMVFSFDLSDKEDYIVAGDGHGKISIWNLSNAQLKRKLEHSSSTNINPLTLAVMLGKNNKYIFSAGESKGIRKWSLKENKSSAVYGEPFSYISSIRTLDINQAGDSLIYAGMNQRIYELDITNNKIIGEFSFSGSSGIASISYSPNGKYIIAGNANGNIIYFKILKRTDKRENRTFNSNYPRSTKKLNKHKKTIMSIDIDSSGKYALSASADNDVVLWDLEGGKFIKKFSGHKAAVMSVSFSKNAKYFLSASMDGKIILWDIKTKLKLKILSVEDNSKVLKVRFFNNDKYTIASYSTGKIIIWNLETGNKIVTMINFLDDDWLSITPEGYFNGSKNAAQYLNITRTTKDGLEPFDFSQLYDHFFRPDLVKLKLAGEEEAYQKAINGMTYEEALKNPPPKLSFKTIDNNKAKTSGYSYDDIKTSKRNLPLNFNIKQTDNGGIGLVRIYQEGKLIQTIGEGIINRKSADVFSQFQQNSKDELQKQRQEQKLLASKGADSSQLRKQAIANVAPSKVNNPDGNHNIDLELISGDNEICIEAFNKTNTVTSYRECVIIKADVPKVKPTLYVIAVGANDFKKRLGVGHNLHYSINDANTTANVLKGTQAKAYDKVVVKTIFGDKMNKENLFEAIKEIKSTALLEDTIIFYISNHGEATKGELYFLVNTYYDTNDISFKELFQELQSIKSLNQIYIVDTCQSGEAADIVSSVYDSRASVFARSSGVHMLLATTKGTSAFESKDPKVKHGVFTHKILQALKNKKSDKNKDSYISVIELSDVLKDPANNVEYQYPVIRNVGNDVRVGKVK